MFVMTRQIFVAHTIQLCARLVHGAMAGQPSAKRGPSDATFTVRRGSSLNIKWG